MRAQDILSDNVHEVHINGTTVRKGSVGAFLANAAALEDPCLTAADRDAVLSDIEAALPALRAVGLFSVLEIRNAQLRAFVEARS